MRILSGVVWFSILVLMMHGLKDIYGPLLRKRIVKFAVAPGVIVFLFFKILACYIAGAKVKEIKPFDDNAELLQYEKPGLGAVGEFLIGALPFTCLLLSFVLLYSFSVKRGFEVPPLPLLPRLWEEPHAFAVQMWDFVAGFFKCAGRAAGQAWFWGIAYGAVNVLLAGAPGFKALKHIAIAVALVALGAAGFQALKIRIGAGEARNFFDQVAFAFSFLMGAGLSWVVLSVFTVGAWRLFLADRDGKKK